MFGEIISNFIFNLHNVRVRNLLQSIVNFLKLILNF